MVFWKGYNKVIVIKSFHTFLLPHFPMNNFRKRAAAAWFGRAREGFAFQGIPEG